MFAADALSRTVDLTAKSDDIELEDERYVTSIKETRSDKARNRK